MSFHFFNPDRLLRTLAVILLPIVVLLLSLSEYQDRTILAQSQAIEFWQWAGGFEIPRTGLVLEALEGPSPCYVISLNDPFPIGSPVRLCMEGEALSPGTSLRVWVQRNQIHSIEVLPPLAP